MAKHEPAAHQARNDGRSRVRSATASVAVSFGILVTIVAPGILPSWGTSTTLTGSPSFPGALDLQLGGSSGTARDRGAVNFALDALVPGDSKAVLVTLANAGDANFTYSATATSTVGASGGNLSPALRFSVVVGGTATGGPRTGSCVGGTTSFGPSPLAASASKVIPVAPSSSPLLPGQAESICIVVALPEDTGNSAQGDSAEASFVFQASQVT